MTNSHYANDPLRGNKRAHAIKRKLRDGWPSRKIAKHLNIGVAEVKRVEKLVRGEIHSRLS